MSDVILHVVGARPNFMKLAPVHRALAARGVPQRIVHTGQHYDAEMSERFFLELGLPRPDDHLEVGSGTHAVQTALIMTRIEPVLEQWRPRWTVLYGDVNSTVAAALVAAKRGFRVAHVEAGLRSGDRTMPEELNRLVTDRLADLLLTPSRDADANLRAEGVPAGAIVFVGNVMIDTLLHTLARARALDVAAIIGQAVAPHVLVTLHRPSNVDDPARLKRILAELERLAATCPVVFPLHPRTAERITALGARSAGNGLHLLGPVRYSELVALMASARAVLTDSGGIQEETSVLGIPCVTLRPNTERPITIDQGTNRLEADPARAVDAVLAPRAVTPLAAEGWDGAAGERIAAALVGR
ncbi:MAG: non-hydrolyzing UDP-N-acetylglucosamine 2-epimerase [Gemmatimonadota bacterium]